MNKSKKLKLRPFEITSSYESYGRHKWREIPANMPGQFSLSGQIFLHKAARTLKGIGEFQNKKIYQLKTTVDTRLNLSESELNKFGGNTTTEELDLRSP